MHIQIGTESVLPSLKSYRGMPHLPAPLSCAHSLSRTRMLAGVGNRATPGTCCPRSFCDRVDVR